MTHLLTLTPQNANLSGAWNKGDTVLVKCDATDAAFSVYLPYAASSLGVEFHFQKTDAGANAVTIYPMEPAFINNETSQQLTIEGDSMHLISDEANWWIV